MDYIFAGFHIYWHTKCIGFLIVVSNILLI